MASGWRFLVDENLDPQIATYLEKEDIDAEHVSSALFKGADDDEDVLPYARDRDQIVVTNDLEHFTDRAEREHEGIVIVYDGECSALEIVSGLLDIVDSYPHRGALRGYEVLDEWL